MKNILKKHYLILAFSIVSVVLNNSCSTTKSKLIRKTASAEMDLGTYCIFNESDDCSEAPKPIPTSEEFNKLTTSFANSRWRCDSSLQNSSYDFSGKNFSNAQFSGCTFVNATIKENSDNSTDITNLDDISSNGLSFKDCKVSDVTFGSGANPKPGLFGAEFNKCSFKNVTMMDLSLDSGKFKGVTFTNTLFSNSTFHNVDFSNSQFETNKGNLGSYFENSTFTGNSDNASNKLANMDGTIFVGVAFQTTLFKNMSMKNCNFSQVKSFSGVVFENVDLSGCNFQNKNLGFTKFINVKLNGVNFTGADLSNTEFKNINEFIDVNFTNTKLDMADFSGKIIAGSNFKGSSINANSAKFKNAKYSYYTELDSINPDLSEMEIPKSLQNTEDPYFNDPTITKVNLARWESWIKSSSLQLKRNGANATLILAKTLKKNNLLNNSQFLGSIKNIFLTAFLKESSLEIQVTGLSGLGVIGITVAPTIVEALNHPNETIRKKAAQIINNTKCEMRQSEPCGIAHFNAKREKPCKAELYKEKNDVACGEVYVSKATDKCEPAVFKEMRQHPCDAETYNSQANSAICGDNIVQVKVCDTDIPFIKRKCRWENVNHGAKTCAHPSFGSKTYKACRHSSFGVETYKACRHKTHGVESFLTCRLEKFGVEKYQECEHANFGTKEFKTCLVEKNDDNLCTSFD